MLVSLYFLFPLHLGYLSIIFLSQDLSNNYADGFFPSSYSLDSFKKLFIDTSLYNYPRWFMNTLIISSVSCIVGIFVILTAYTMFRMEIFLKKKLNKTTIWGMFPSLWYDCGLSINDSI